MRYIPGLLVLFFCAPALLGGGADISEALKIDFTDPEEASEKATWSDPERLDVTGDGLGWDGAETSLINGWILTEPVGVGRSWQPAQRVHVHVVLTPALRPIHLPDGQVSTPFAGSLFVRHSPDGGNWSNWQPLDRDLEQTEEGRHFLGTVAVPRRSRAAYEELMAEYRQLDVPWHSDEEAMAHWIVERDPEFFRDNKPFIGYVQFLYEGNFRGGQRITQLRVRTGIAFSGPVLLPDDPEAFEGHGGPWRFRAPE